MKTIDNKGKDRYFASPILRGVTAEGIKSLFIPRRFEKIERGKMAAQRKTIARRISAKDREFEELLRRAALNAKRLTQTNLHVVRRKRVRAA
jgi:hypothetical protein